MANTIALIEKYIPLLDEKYKWEAKSSILDASADLVRATMQAKTVLLPKMTLQGLGDYSRAAGYVNGDVTLEWQSHTFTQDRGRSFSVDAMDNEETAGVSFGRLAGEFIRLHVAPEVDAYRFSTYASKAANKPTGPPTNETILGLIDAATATMDDAEVPEEGRILFISNEAYNLLLRSSDIQRRLDVNANNGTVNRQIITLDNMRLIKVPKGRFNTEFTFNDGTTVGQTAGGFTATGKDINFMIIHPTAALQIVKTAVPRVFDPMTNQDAHAWKYDYRLYHDAFTPDEKTNGIYVHHKA
jgi:hypothetical protein